MRGLSRNRAQVIGTKEDMTPTVAELSARAMRTMTARFKPSAKDPTKILVEGPCPNCAHPTSWESPLKFFTTPTGVAWLKRRAVRFSLADNGLGKIILTPTETEFSLQCRCGKKGRDHEDGSCKAVWNMRVAKRQ